MRVEAKPAPEGKPSGFYGESLRMPGDIFYLADIKRGGIVKSFVAEQFSEQWMIDIDDSLEKEKDGSFKKNGKAYVLRPKPLKSEKKVKLEA